MFITLVLMRPKKSRRIEIEAKALYYKPRGITMSQLDEIQLDADELEAFRLADVEKLYQEEAARRMGVSRTTYGRILGAAREKAATALVRGSALKISGKEK
jgi:predicted DNA-binding protein (UPF0251 family)